MKRTRLIDVLQPLAVAAVAAGIVGALIGHEPIVRAARTRPLDTISRQGGPSRLDACTTLVVDPIDPIDCSYITCNGGLGLGASPDSLDPVAHPPVDPVGSTPCSLSQTWTWHLDITEGECPDVVTQVCKSRPDGLYKFSGRYWVYIEPSLPAEGITRSGTAWSVTYSGLHGDTTYQFIEGILASVVSTRSVP